MPNTTDLNKQRDIVFSSLPSAQLERAYQFLSNLAGCKVELRNSENTLRVTYNLQQHTLEELETLLTDAGFQLDHSMLHNIERNVIYYCEDTICHNLEVPEHPTKQNEREVFVKAYEQESHGDNDGNLPKIINYK